MSKESEEKKADAVTDAPSEGPVKKEAEAAEETPEETPKEEKSPDLNVCYGLKAGMTRIFDDAGNHVPVTVIKLIPNTVSQVKTKQRDGYDAYQVAYGQKREKLINQPKRGVLQKAKIQGSFCRLSEVKASGDAQSSYLGKEVDVSFKEGSYVDVSGVSKGKGFQGVLKKFGFKGGPKSHGSKFHRTGGSIGNRATPGKVWKNKKMPGAMGRAVQTVQNLKVVELNKKDGYLLVKGSVPGAKNNFVRVGLAVKKLVPSEV